MKKKICILMASALLMTGCSRLGVGTNKSGSEKLTYWLEINPNIKSVVTDYAETPFAKKLMEETGVDIEFKQQQSVEQFNLMLSSNDLPDVIETSWSNYPGGPDKAIEEKLILPLNDYIEEKAPNLSKYFKEHPEVKKACMTDDGKIYMFPFVRGDKSLLISYGPMVRQDWLEDLGLPLPETMDDWYNMLKAFKTEKHAETPLTMNGYEFLGFVGAYGAPRNFFIDDAGMVKYGPIEENYLAFLKEMNKWYSEGLLDRNFTGSDAKIVDSSILNGKAGATTGSLGGGLGKWMSAATEEGYALVGTKHPVLHKGEKSQYSCEQNVVPGLGASISGSCKNIDAAFKVLDYAYSEEGKMLYNFGIEGESYEMVDGYPKYTEKIVNNPDGEPMAQILSMYVRSTALGPFVQDPRYYEQYAGKDYQQDALKKWCDTDCAKHLLPLLSLTAEESKEYAAIMNECKTYEDENTIAFITGTKSFDEWDSYLEQMKVLGIDKALKIQQDAYERYLSR